MMRSLVVELADDGVELIEGDALVGGGLVVDVGGVEELEEVVVVDGVVELLGNALELLEVNESVLVLVEEGKDALETVLGLSLTDTTGNGIDELILGDGLVLLLEPVDQVQDEGVPLVEAQLLQHLVDLDGIDGPAVVLVEHLEGVHQLLVVLQSQTVLPRSGHHLHGLGGGSWGLSSTAGHSAHNIWMINNNFYYGLEGIGSGGQLATVTPSRQANPETSLKGSRLINGEA